MVREERNAARLIDCTWGGKVHTLRNLSAPTVTKQQPQPLETHMNHEEFITRWQRSGGAEMANSQSFLKELCQLLELPEPEPTQTDESQNNYVFEKALNFNNGDGTFSAGRVDLYWQRAFVLESKQGAERRANELAEALATVTRQQTHRKGTAQ